MQLVSVLLVVEFLEDNARNISPGGQRPDALVSLDWVTSLSAKQLDSFLINKLDERKNLVELDLEPSGLVIKHDDDGQVETVEPAILEKVRSTRLVGIFNPWGASYLGFLLQEELLYI